MNSHRYSRSQRILQNFVLSLSRCSSNIQSKTPAYASIAGAFDCIFSSLLAQKRTSLLRLVQNKFKILTLLLNGTYVNTLYEVLLTEWVDDHERKDSYDSCCIRNCCWVNSTIIRNITINNHTS